MVLTVVVDVTIVVVEVKMMEVRIGQLRVGVVKDRVGGRTRVERRGQRRWFEVDLELVVVAHVERVEAPVGVLELLGTVYRERLDVDVEHLK